MNSCIGCKYLYKQDLGYSNYTVEETSVICAKERNPLLPADEPYDWSETVDADNWSATMGGRCEFYALGALVCLDVDGEATPEQFTDDKEQIEAIRKSAWIE